MLRGTDNLIVKQVTRFLLPLIQLFSLYVIFHGHYSPGGGFQGGALLAASFILHRIVFGQQTGTQLFSTRGALTCGVLGLLLYITIGGLAWFGGGAFLDYAAFPFGASVPTAELRSIGILLVEIGVATTVVGTLVALFDLLTTETLTP